MSAIDDAKEEFVCAAESAGILEFHAEAFVQVMSCAVCAVPKENTKNMLLLAMRRLTALTKKHFSDGIYEQDKDSFIRDLFASANKIINGEEP